MAVSNAAILTRNPRIHVLHTPMRIPLTIIILQIRSSGWAAGQFVRVSARIHGQSRRVTAAEWQRLKLASITTGIQQL